MSNRIGSIISAAVVLAALAAPALADTTDCKVTAPEIRVRKTPSKKARIIAVLKKNDIVNTTDKCAGGWVKVSSKDGRISGYVGGWALESSSPQVSAAPAEAAHATPAAPATAAATTPATEPAAEQKSTPTNDQLAFQITEMRLRVLNLERSMKRVKHDIRKIKATMAHNTAAEKNSNK